MLERNCKNDGRKTHVEINSLNAGHVCFPGLHIPLRHMIQCAGQLVVLRLLYLSFIRDAHPASRVCERFWPLSISQAPPGSKVQELWVRFGTQSWVVHVTYQASKQMKRHCFTVSAMVYSTMALCQSYLTRERACRRHFAAVCQVLLSRKSEAKLEQKFRKMNNGLASLGSIPASTTKVLRRRSISF